MENKKPQIRFDEFVTDWEQGKLEDYLEVSKKKNIDEIFDKKDVLSVSGDYGVVNQIEFQGRSFAGESVANYGIVETSDVVYTKSPLKQNPYGIIKTNKGAAGIVSTLYAVYKPKENVNPEFIQAYFEQNARMNNYMRPLVNKGAKNDMKVSDENALKGEVIFPQKDEQTKISDFFQRLDSLISLQQNKYDSLVQLKKSMLEKMFPVEGRKVPEIRFDGFTGDWKQRKLGEISNKITTKNIGTQYVETFTNSAEYGIISQRDFFDHDITNIEKIDGYYVVEDEAFVYNPRISALAPVGPINRNKLGRTGVMSPLYTAFKTYDVCNEYLEWFFKSNGWHSFMRFNGDSGARSDRFSIKDAVFFEMPIPMPDIGEQKKIGKYFTELENFIALNRT